jgi:hypothetical protein
VATDLAKLVVRLEAQTAQYMAGMQAAEQRLAKFNKQAVGFAAGVGASIGQALTGLASRFVDMGKAAIDNADNLNKLSQATGVSVEALSQLQFAADLSGLSTEELAASLSKLARAGTEAAAGSRAQVDAFERLGVSVKNTDGSLKGTEELLLDVAQAFSQLEDGLAKNALAQDLFGKSGAKMIPFLNAGREGIEALRKEADALGLTITSSAAQSAERFNDALSTVSGAAGGLVNTFVQEALPVFEKIAQRFVDAARDGGALNVAVGALSVAFKGLFTAGVVVVSVFQQVGLAINGFITALALLRSGRLGEAVDILKDRFAQMRDNISKDVETIVSVWQDAAPKVETAAKAAGAALQVVDEEARKASEGALNSITALADGLRQQVATFGLGAKATIEYRIAQGDLADEFAKAGAAGQALRQQIIGNTEILSLLEERTQAAKKAEEEATAVRQEGLAVFEATRTPAEQYIATIDRLGGLLQARAIDFQTYQRAIEQAQAAFDQQNVALQEGIRVFEETRTPAEQYEARLQRLQELLAQNAINQDTFNRATAQAKDAFDTAVKGSQKGAQELQGFLTQALTGGFEDGARGILRGFIQLLLQMQAQALAAKITQAIFGAAGAPGAGGGTGSLLGALFGGTRSTGGDASAGKEYIVGERGPERFVPDVNGRIMSNDSLAPQITVNPQIINVRDPNEIPNAIQSGAGEAAIINIIGRNPGVIKQLLQGG